ncbi:MAG: adenylosuccinate lyase [Victivallales bacterium]|nr:adenylosuccinate lyase [Victivallales bacterium]
METDDLHLIFQSPFSQRYASQAMQRLFSDHEKFSTWRKLWVALAEAERELGLDITQAQIEEMKAHLDDVNYEVAKEREKQVRHDVMAHVYAFGQQCPTARPVIHLGATSCYVGDNTDMIIMAKALRLLKGKLLTVIRSLTKFAREYRALPTLGFTHFQPAQPTTVGKRATLWLQDLVFDVQDVDYVLGTLRLLGSKGTTGTQASFLDLFNGDHEKCRRLDQLIAEKMGFPGCYPVSGQTYSRKNDARVVNVLSGIAQSAAKFSNDLRLLQHLKEVEEPFEKQQIGSSAMAYKRNPMRSERIASLARFVIANAANPALTASTQWLERTLDDSANRRVAVSEAFLAVDGILDIYANVANGLVVYPKVIARRLEQELPFMATENLLMEGVKAGGDRQELHEIIRRNAQAAGDNVKNGDGRNDLLERLAKDEHFAPLLPQLKEQLRSEKFVGRAPEQVDEFLAEVVEPLLAANPEGCLATDELKV